MGQVMLYGVAIKDASASNDLEKMKAIAAQAKQLIKEQGDIYTSLLDLLEKIETLEKGA